MPRCVLIVEATSLLMKRLLIGNWGEQSFSSALPANGKTSTTQSTASKHYLSRKNVLKWRTFFSLNLNSEKITSEDALIERKDSFSPEQAGWYEYIADCISTKACPNCGEDLYFDEDVTDKNFGKIIFFGCSKCDWQEYTWSLS